MVSQIKSYLTENIIIFLIGSAVIFYILSKKRKDINDLESYNWSKFSVLNEGKLKVKKQDYKDKQKIRVKGFNKGSGFVKEENSFPINFTKKKEEGQVLGSLSEEEIRNLQDMLNYAATINNKNEDNVEAMYNQIHSTQNKDTNPFTNEKIDNQMKEILQK